MSTGTSFLSRLRAAVLAKTFFKTADRLSLKTEQFIVDMNTKNLQETIWFR